MVEGNSQRIYLTCGSAFLLVFCFAAMLGIIKVGTGAQVEVIAVIVLSVNMAILLFNVTLLCGSNGGAKVLAAGKTFLWLSFFLIAAAISLCIVLMLRSL
jgi:hypothetical protein